MDIFNIKISGNMSRTFITLIFIIIYSSIRCCSFAPISFCNTVNQENPNNTIVRGYFSDLLSNGLIFTRLETLRGDENRDEITIWDNLPFDCNGLHQRLAAFMGNINEEIIISIAPIDSIYFEGETAGDYRVPEGLWWETHNLKVVGDSVFGNLISNDYTFSTSMYYDDFISKVIDNSQCLISTISNSSNHQISIYPTLVADNINIQNYTSPDGSKLMVYDNNSQRVICEELSEITYLGNLPKGMYIVVVLTSDKKYFIQKIIKI